MRSSRLLLNYGTLRLMEPSLVVLLAWYASGVLGTSLGGVNGISGRLSGEKNVLLDMYLIFL